MISTGLLGTAMAARLCGEVRLYGFGNGSDTSGAAAQSHARHTARHTAHPRHIRGTVAAQSWRGHAAVPWQRHASAPPPPLGATDGSRWPCALAAAPRMPRCQQRLQGSSRPHLKPSSVTSIPPRLELLRRRRVRPLLGVQPQQLKVPQPEQVLPRQGRVPRLASALARAPALGRPRHHSVHKVEPTLLAPGKRRLVYL